MDEEDFLFNDLNDENRIDDELWEKEREYDAIKQMEWSYKEVY